MHVEPMEKKFYKDALFVRYFKHLFKIRSISTYVFMVSLQPIRSTETESKKFVRLVDFIHGKPAICT